MGDGWVCEDGLTNYFWEVLEKALFQTLGFSFWAESLGMEVPLFQEYTAKLRCLIDNFGWVLV